MMKMLKIILIVTFAAFCKTSRACDCDSIISISESKLAFKGKVIDIKEVNDSISHYEITFRVKKVLKGKRKVKYIKVNTPCLTDGCCGIEFNKNDIFLVVTREKYGQVYADACTATMKIK
jgi:hypothetical protein